MAVTTRTYEIRIRPDYCGAWDSGTAYEFWDMVYDADTGCSYLCISADGAEAGTELTDTSCWVLTADQDAMYAALAARVEELEAAALTAAVDEEELTIAFVNPADTGTDTTDDATDTTDDGTDTTDDEEDAG